jgi:hypothetical protein
VETGMGIAKKVVAAKAVSGRRDDKQTAFFFLKYIREYIHPCLLFFQCVHGSIPCSAHPWEKPWGNPL